LAGFKNVHLYEMNSPDFLRLVRPQVSQPAVFWLDAHWCGGPRIGPECPLLLELAEIKGTFGHSVILADDANYMTAPPPPPHDPSQWPTMDHIRAFLDTWNEQLDVWIHPSSNTDVLVITPRGGQQCA
jgi:hypothetical protein